MVMSFSSGSIGRNELARAPPLPFRLYAGAACDTTATIIDDRRARAGRRRDRRAVTEAGSPDSEFRRSGRPDLSEAAVRARACGESEVRAVDAMTIPTTGFADP